MAVISVHYYGDVSNVGGTIQLDGPLEVEPGSVIVLKPSVYTTKGTWTLYTYTALVGSASDITVDASALVSSLGLSSSNFTPVDTGTSLIVTLN